MTDSQKMRKAGVDRKDQEVLSIRIRQVCILFIKEPVYISDGHMV